jgi:hypothetical protein
MMTVTGSSAATAPFMPISALKIAATAMRATISVVSLAPLRRRRSWPAHAPTPVVSTATAMASSAAIRITTGSPKPVRASGMVRTPAK